MKVGDKVRIVKSPYVAESLQPGKTARIVKVTFDGFEVVTCDEYADKDGDLSWPFYPYELEAI